MLYDEIRFDNEPNPLDAVIEKRNRDIIPILLDAIAANRFALAYQPVVSSRDYRKILFHEGLIRVFDEQKRLIEARNFIQKVEEDEIGREIDCAALALGFHALKRIPNLRISINMSARSLGYPKWTAIFFGTFKKNPSLASRLILEMKESSAMALPEIVRTFMAETQKLGITFALDNFGAESTSFRFLMSFMFDIIKIDGQFSRGVCENSNSQVLVAALRDIGKNFDMLTISEGVESQIDAQYLSECGVDGLQGYFIERPTLRPSWSIDT